METFTKSMIDDFAGRIKNAGAQADQAQASLNAAQSNLAALNGVQSFLTSLEPNGFAIVKTEEIQQVEAMLASPDQDQAAPALQAPVNGVAPRAAAPGRR